MKIPSLMRHLAGLGPVLVLSGLAACTSATDKPTTGSAATPRADSISSYPPAEGFDMAGSDARAQALADQVMRQMGGYQAWQKARLLGWDFLDNSYQIWDKQTGDFHWQKDSLVANYNLTTKQGHAYRSGKDISDTEDGKKLLSKMYPIWVNNSWWLLMPFKLKDSGVTLTYKGAGTFMDGTTPAEVLNMTFKNVGVTPDNKYEVLVNPKTNLVEEWAYFPKATDEKPAFRRRWMDYKQYGPLKLATDRTDGKDGRHLDHVSVSATVPAGIMDSKVPVQKL